MTVTHANHIDPTLAVAERQLAMLGEVAQIALELSRAHGASALAAAHAVEVILADEYWQPETGRARALAGSRDAAEAFQKVSRSLRLTLAMELSIAETVRDLRAGVCTNGNAPISGRRPDAGYAPSILQSAAGLDRRRLAGAGDTATDHDRAESDFERLHEFDRPDRRPRGTFREVVDQICAEIGVIPDWEGYSAGRSPLRYEPLQPKPPGWSECRPPGSMTPEDRDDREYSDAPLLESVTPPQTPP